MKQLFTIGALLLSGHLLASSEEWCLEQDPYSSLYNFSQEIETVLDQVPGVSKVLDVTVTKFGSNQGTGKVSIVADAEGNISSIKVDFKLKDQKNTVLAKSLNEINAGESLNYINGTSKIPVLVVQKSGSQISPTQGGEFIFKVLSKKPDSYSSFKIFLRKHDGVWIAKDSSGQKISSVDLNPNLSGFEWAGTFGSVKFK